MSGNSPIRAPEFPSLQLPMGGELVFSVFGYKSLASPRATIALDRCARAHAWLAGRDYVTPIDIQTIAHDVLRHRILLSFETEAAGRTPDQIVDVLLSRVGVP